MKVIVDAGSEQVELDDGVLVSRDAALGELGEARAVRLVFAATHLVMEPGYADVPHTLESPVPPEELTQHIDWQATFALRKRLDGFGFGIAEAMDTAQRFQIGWHNAQRLIEGTGAMGLANGFIAGAGVDHLDSISDEDALVKGVCFQVRAIQAAGGMAILLPLLWLPQSGAKEADYVRVYGRVIEACDGPLFVHWLGEMFLPALAGYFPGESFSKIMALDPSKVRGAKLSLLDSGLERRLRAELMERDQIMLTGDDFHFGDLMAGGPAEREVDLAGRKVGLGDFSHGLLGIFDGIARPANLALRYLAHGKIGEYTALMEPCERLGLHLFEKPTQHYKAGLAFLSWLNGAQGNPMLVQHEERARDKAHYLQAARLASLAGVIENAELAAVRLRRLLSAPA